MQISDWLLPICIALSLLGLGIIIGQRSFRFALAAFSPLIAGVFLYITAIPFHSYAHWLAAALAILSGYFIVFLSLYLAFFKGLSSNKTTDIRSDRLI